MVYSPVSTPKNPFCLHTISAAAWVQLSAHTDCQLFMSELNISTRPSPKADPPMNLMGPGKIIVNSKYRILTIRNYITYLGDSNVC